MRLTLTGWVALRAPGRPLRFGHFQPTPPAVLYASVPLSSPGLSLDTDLPGSACPRAVATRCLVGRYAGITVTSTTDTGATLAKRLESVKSAQKCATESAGGVVTLGQSWAIESGELLFLVGHNDSERIG